MAESATRAALEKSATNHPEFTPSMRLRMEKYGGCGTSTKARARAAPRSPNTGIRKTAPRRYKNAPAVETMKFISALPRPLQNQSATRAGDFKKKITDMTGIRNEDFSENSFPIQRVRTASPSRINGILIKSPAVRANLTDFL